MDFGTLFANYGLALFFKIALLILILLFVIFVIILFNHVKSLGKIVIIKDVAGASLIRSLAVLYVVFAVSLFLLAVVIL